jgi:6-phosphofructokinase
LDRAARRYRGRRGRDLDSGDFAIVVVSEGAKEAGQAEVYKMGKDAFKEHAVLGGIGERLARQIETATGCESRSVVLGHLQRGGTPVGYDRLLAQRMGCAAVRYLAETDRSGMVAEVGGEMTLVPLELIVGGIRGVDPTGDTVMTGRDVGICFGDELSGTFLNRVSVPQPVA